MRRFGLLSVLAVGVLGFLAGVLLVIVVALSSHDPGPPRSSTASAPPGAARGPTVPRVVNERYDAAQRDVQRAGYVVAHQGGGLLGPIVDSNWKVIAQRPEGGRPLTRGRRVILFLQRA